MRTTNTVSGLLEGVTYYFAVTAYNSEGLESEPSNEVTNTVQFTTAPPVISPLTNVVVNEDTPFNVRFTVYDPDTPLAALMLSSRSSNPLLLSPMSVFFEGIGTNRSALVVPTPNQSGTAVLTFVVGDGLQTAESSFSVTVSAVNDPPMFAPLPDVGLAQNAGSQSVPLTGITTGAPNEIQTLTLTATSSNTALIPPPTILYTTPLPTAQLSFTPRQNRTGSSKITVALSDGQSTTSRSFIVYVRSTQNTPPLISAITNNVINEDASTGALPFTVSDSSTPVSLLTAQAISSDTLLVPANRLILGGSDINRTLTVNPAANRYGTATITLAVMDTNLGYASTSFQLTVLPINDRPTISAIQDQLGTASTWIVPFTVNDLETPLPLLTVTATSSNLALVQSSGLVISGSGTNRALIISPQRNQFGSSVITVLVSDGIDSGSSQFLFTVPPPPRLSIAHTTNSVLISWPTSAATYQLERLHSSAWEPESQSAQLLGSNRVLTVLPTNSASLYRLRRVE